MTQEFHEVSETCKIHKNPPLIYVSSYNFQ